MWQHDLMRFRRKSVKGTPQQPVAATSGKGFGLDWFELGRYEVTAFTSPALDALLDAIRATHTFGDVLFTQVRAVDVDDPGQWFRIGASIYWDNEVFRSLFDCSAVRTALRELRIPDPYPIAKPPQFYQSRTKTFTLSGELAHALVDGGAYSGFSGSPAEAMRLAAAAVFDIVGDRHDQFRVFGSQESWTRWFGDIAWDQTWIVVDYERLLVSILCKTDTD